MSRLQAFFVTFAVTFGIMLCMFGGLYHIVRTETRAAETKQQGIAVEQLQPKESKTLLWVNRGEGGDTFFVIKLNAIQNKVTVVALGEDFYMDKRQRTLGQAMAYAGVRQCVQDLSEHFDIKISWHLVCDGKTAADMLGFMENSSAEIRGEGETGGEAHIAAKTAELLKMLDIPVGNTDFYAQTVCGLIKANMPQICSNMKTEIRNRYTDISTDLNTADVSQLEKIAQSLCNDAVVYTFVGTGSDNVTERVQTELNG